MSAMSETAKKMHSNEETAALVEQAKQGDRGAFEVPARRYFRAVYASALAQIGIPEDAEDVAQDAMVLAFEHLPGAAGRVRQGL